VHSNDGNDLLKHVGVNLECTNKSYYFLDAFVGCFVTMASDYLYKKKATQDCATTNRSCNKMYESLAHPITGC
jgi:hypothetical protein